MATPTLTTLVPNATVIPQGAVTQSGMLTLNNPYGLSVAPNYNIMSVSANTPTVVTPVKPPVVEKPTEAPTEKPTEAPFDASIYKGYVKNPDLTPIDDFVWGSYISGAGTKDDFNNKILNPYVDSIMSMVDTSSYTSEQVASLRKGIAEGKSLQTLGANRNKFDPSKKKDDPNAKKITTALTDPNTGALDSTVVGGTNADGTPKIASKADVAKTELFTLGKHLNADGTYSDVIVNPTNITPTATNGMLTADAIAKISAGFDPTDPRFMTADKIKNLLIDTNDKGQYAADRVADLVANAKSQDVNVAQDSLVSHRLAGLLSANNPYLQDARNQATLMSSRRGLLNSGAAAGYAQDAAIRAGKDIATADASVYADAQKANAAAANGLINTGLQLNSGAVVSDAKNYNSDLAANALAQQNGVLNDASNSLKVATINNANAVTAAGVDAKTITEQANTQFAADNRKQEVQATLDSGGLQFNAGAANTASNNYNSEWNTMTRQISAGNIDLASKAAVNAYNMLEASQENGYKSQQMALAQEYSLQGIRLTGQIDFDKLQFQATIDTAQKTQDRNAQTMVSMYNGLLEYSKVIDTTVGFKAETKAALKNEAYVKISEALNTLTNSKSLNIAEILQPPETGKTAGYIKGTSFANLNDLAFTANKWGADFYSKKWTDLTDAQVSEIEKNKNKSPYWKEMVRSLDANSFASLKAPVTPVSPETAATINS